VLSAGVEGQAQIWDIEAQKIQLTLPVHAGIAYEATWHPTK